MTIDIDVDLNELKKDMNSKLSGRQVMYALRKVDVNLIELRRKIGMVFSSPVMLPLSIRENIIY